MHRTFLILTIWGVVVAQIPDILPNSCYITNPAAVGKVYQQNLDQVFDFLLDNTFLNNSTTYDYGSEPDDVYGHSECYNMSKGDCKQCIEYARSSLRGISPHPQGAKTLVNESGFLCYVEYDNHPFVSEYGIPPAATSFHSKRRRTSDRSKVIITGVVLGVTALAFAIVSLAFFIRKKKQRTPPGIKKFVDILRGRIKGPRVYRHKELLLATGNFGSRNKIGQGGFGTVYKGVFSDGTVVAVKKLLSTQGKDDFINEVIIVGRIQHKNLVKLKGYCVEGTHRMLILEFLENGNLETALFSAPGRVLDWPSRYNIILGIAEGLAYLHEGLETQIIHRDIKPSNILLDDNLTPKIGDFGVSKLFDRDKGFTSTRVVGTLGYLAPEYALRGELTEKADVFSFGVLLLEILSGRKCHSKSLPAEEEFLLDWAWHLKDNMKLERIIDKRLVKQGFNMDEAITAIHIAFSCTREEADDRPVMSQAVAMLLGYLEPSLPVQRPGYIGQMNSNTSYQITELEPR